MDIKLAKKLIRTVGSECGYTVSGKPSDNSFDVYFDRNRHGVAFQIKHSTHPKAEKMDGYRFTIMRESQKNGESLFTLCVQSVM